MRLHNAGVGGSRTWDALLRFDQDIASYKPKYITVLLGMNDGRYSEYFEPRQGTSQLIRMCLLFCVFRASVGVSRLERSWPLPGHSTLEPARQSDEAIARNRVPFARRPRVRGHSFFLTIL